MYDIHMHACMYAKLFNISSCTNINIYVRRDFDIYTYYTSHIYLYLDIANESNYAGPTVSPFDVLHLTIMLLCVCVRACMHVCASFSLSLALFAVHISAYTHLPNLSNIRALVLAP